MPICTRCGKGYEGSDHACPACGTPSEFVPSRCGTIGMLAMRIAWGAAFLAVIVCLLGGIIALFRGQWLAGLLLIFIIAPVGYGQHVALGMAIDYAQGDS